MSDYSKFFVPGSLILPDNISKKAQARASNKFVAPKELVLDGYCTPVENQGDQPFCAAYAATSLAESMLWRKNHYHEDIDPVPIYNEAKTIDQHPDENGTTLEAALQALINKGYFDKDKYRVKVFGGKPLGCTDGLRSVKFAIHEYGCCVAGFNITKEWYSPSFFTDTIKYNKKSPILGGHAVLICGYTKDKVRLLNSWGKSYADKGFVWITNDAFNAQFVLGGVLAHD